MKIIRFKRIVPLVMLSFFLLALWSLYRQLQGYRWHDLMAHIHQMPAGQVRTALMLTLASFLVISIYDFLALKYIRHRLPFAKTALASFLGHTFSNNAGFSFLAGASIRYWIYSAWEVSAVKITQVVLFCSVSCWLGFLGLGAIVFISAPLSLPRTVELPFLTTRPLGLILLMLLLVYMALTFLAPKAVSIKGRPLILPPWPLAAGQLLVAALDWFLAGTILYTLLPQPAAMPITGFMAIFLLAQLGGLVSQVPGGLGVFESIFLLLSAPAVAAPQLMGVLIVYRGIYYLLPFLIAMAMVGIAEAMRRKTLLSRAWRPAARFRDGVLTPALSRTVFFTGASIFFAGIVPGGSGLRRLWCKVGPLPVMDPTAGAGLCRETAKRTAGEADPKRGIPRPPGA